ncbi:MAG TPA: C10 family peptidase [Bacteroidales bacterium]|nr:C10 family peptidase [Bacteroidales bacterium]
MKKILFSLLLLILSFNMFANPIDIASAERIVLHKLISTSKNTNYSIKDIYPISENEIIYFYLVELAPTGYFIISADDNLPPVIAYSFENNSDIQSSITGFFKFDLKTRLEAVNFLPEEVIKERKAMWNKLLSDDYTRDREFEQWPEEGTTPTGGWLESSWNQGSPWNAMCPIDPVTSVRSYTGCPATAMAMILNYHKTSNYLYFTDEDDYNHNYAGRNFRFDDDWETIGFPSFTILNTYLATLNSHWQNLEAITNEDMAALSFACGLIAHQVYTSEGSGTFSVSQAYDAYMRINCSTALLYTESDEGLFPTLILNMQHALPAHLAIVDEGWTMGHNIVVDGYNTDNYFHINFGWGGTYNGWYLIPDEMPYGMTVIEGIIVDIMRDNSSENNLSVVKSNIEIYPNPAVNTLFLNHADNIIRVEIFDNAGKVIIHQNQLKNQSQIDIKNLNKGSYFIRIIFEDKSFWTSGFIKI